MNDIRAVMCSCSCFITGMAEDHNHVLAFFSFVRFKDVLSSFLVRKSLNFSGHLSYEFTFMPRPKYVLAAILPEL